MTGRQAIVSIAGLVTLTLTLNAQVKDRAEVLLQAAIKQELVEGDLKGAIEQYKRIAQNSSPEVAAQALVHMAACYDKLGQTEAGNIYERVVREYPTHKEAAAEARAWLDAHRAPSASQQGGLSVEQIWTGPGVDLEGKPSADGRYLTFADWKAGTANLAVRDLRTGENRLLTHDATRADFAENPIPSPDGKQIAYRFGEKDSQIRLINADGTHMRVLSHDHHSNYLSAWSPDGRYLAAIHRNDDRAGAIVLLSTADGSITQLKSTGWRSAALGGFSPDGRFLVYSMDKEPTGGNGGVFLLARDGTVETPLVQGSATFGAPLWSPDGRRVIFVSDRSGTRGLWSIRVTNGRPEGSSEVIQASIGSMSPMGFTRDGSFYYGTQETQVEAYTAEFDPDTLTVAQPVAVTDRSVGNNRDPELSPDSKHVAFVRGRADGPPNELVVRSSVTGEERTMTTLTGAYGMRTLEWFPDGRSVLVADRVDRRKRFRQINIESGEARVLFEAPWEVWTHALSADGKTLFYSVREQSAGPNMGTLRLVKRRLETGEEIELYRKESDGAGLFGLTASPDGTRVAFSLNVDDSKRALLIMPVNGGTPREIYLSGRDELAPQSGMTWTKDGRHIVFSGKCGPGEDRHLCAISSEGGELKPLGLRMQDIPTRMISADGRHIAFTGATSKQELWVIRNLLSKPAR